MNHNYNNQDAALNFGEVCPVCRGTGIELIEREAEGYGLHEFARPCPRCGGKMRLQDETGISSEFAEADLEKFGFDTYDSDMRNIERLVRGYFDKFEQMETYGKGLYLWSKTPGSGKTFLSCSLARSIMLRYDRQLRFITAAGYLAAVGDSYKRQQGTVDSSKIYRECALLVLDDIGAQKTGEWQEQELFRLINDRKNADLVTIFTSNLPPEKLNFEQRTIDRIEKMSVVFQMPEESIRQRKARQEQEEFLREVFTEWI